MQRIYGAALLFLAAAVLCLPIAILRRTALEQRLSHIPRGASLGASVFC
jgi:hypothetical protein